MAEAISGQYADLWKSISRLSKAGGKRIRPYVMLLAYGMEKSGRNVDSVLPAAAAQELLHLALLIHDDIIDRDYTRYGIKNISGQYGELYAPFIKNDNDRRHFSDSAAILAGDLLIVEAHNAIRQCKVESKRIAHAQTILEKSIFHVVGGQLLDTESAFRPSSQANALTIAEQKTASYSFVNPLTMGAALAGATPDTIRRLKEFGLALGTAYQLQDDLLGMFGDEIITGKSISSDIVEGKHTYLIEQFYKLANSSQKESFEAVFCNPTATASEIASAKDLLVDSGARHAVQSAITGYAELANAKLDTLSMDDAARTAFASLVKVCTARAK